MALPKLYTLENIPIVGYTFTFDQQCPECNRRLKPLSLPELFIERLPNCQLMQDEEGHLYISEVLLNRLKAVDAKGFSNFEVIPKPDNQFAVLYPDIQLLPQMQYLAIKSTLDGTWAYFLKGTRCGVCGYPQAVGKKADDQYLTDFQQVTFGHTSHLNTRFVYQDLWNGEDIFYHSESDRPIIITQKIADVLAEFGETRLEQITDRDKTSVQNYMPNLAIQYEQSGWKHSPCSILGPADWINQEVL